MAAAVLVPAVPGHAEEWHEAYRAGLSALARGNARVASERFRRAIAGRPEPGRNVLTYGTNVEPRYYPYLRLAEALLALGDLDGARQALESSAKWNREPADERQTLLARLQAAQAPPATAPAATPSTPTATSTDPPTPAPTTPTAAPTETTPSATAPRPAPTASPASTRVATAPALATRRPTELADNTGSIEIVAQPPGAFVFLDDEPLGASDPQTGRMQKSNVAAGRHRVRITAEGHDDAIGEIGVAAGGAAVFHATLRPRTVAPDRPSPGTVAAFVAVAVALLGTVVWIALRRPSPGWAPLRVNTPLPAEGAGPHTPPEIVNPGVHRDASGQEWFGDYRLIAPIGRGGMATVYRADRRGEVSALKRPLASFLEDPELMERFLREAEIGRTLNHPNIVRVLDRGRIEGVPYMAMELVPGETLQVFLRNWGAAEPRTAASIVAQVAEALDFAHGKHVVHRDVKPSNIMLLLDGTAKVMDFGIARSQRFDGLTTTGVFLGTPHYAAPETIEGQTTDARSDLYSLGVVFYELLTGRKPYDADTPYSLLRRQVTEEAPPPSRVAPVDPALEAIVLRLLRRAPAERPASAEELVLELRDWLNAS